jgi:serine/threonine protein kinase
MFSRTPRFSIPAQPTQERSFDVDLEQVSCPALSSHSSLQSLPEQVQKEIAIMKVLVHPNLVQLLEIINSPAVPHVFLVLEYVDGGPIMKFNPATGRFVYRLTGTTMGESVARSEPSCFSPQHSASGDRTPTSSRASRSCTRTKSRTGLLSSLLTYLLISPLHSSEI